MQFVVIGNPENRRVGYFEAAARAQGFAAPFIIPYLDVLDERVDWGAVLRDCAVLRIESPGENFAVTQRLIALGADHPDLGDASRISAQAARALSFDKGRIYYNRQLALGFFRVLERIACILQDFPTIRVMNSPRAIRLLFDKAACHAHFQAKGVAVPAALYGVKSYEDLRARMHEKRWRQVFIKPVFSSSASGVLAFRAHKGKVQAFSTTRRVGDALYNHLGVKKYIDEAEIRRLVDYFACEGILVERWIPKASLTEGSFDLRIVTIGGKPQHRVIRQSKSPLTNLHLGNQRGKLEVLEAQLGTEGWAHIDMLARRAAHAISGAHYMGLDIMLGTNFKQAYVLEANAFGDLLPRITVEGLNTYEMELATFKH